MASRGWALHDRQTTLFGEVGEPGDVPVPGRVLFKEIDDRPGYYAGLHLRYLDRAELRYMHYDNRADPEAFDAGINDFAWLTYFDSVGLRVETAAAGRSSANGSAAKPPSSRNRATRNGSTARPSRLSARRSVSTAFPCGRTGSTPIISRRASRRETRNPDPPGPPAIHTSVMSTGTSASKPCRSRATYRCAPLLASRHGPPRNSCNCRFDTRSDRRGGWTRRPRAAARTRGSDIRYTLRSSR